MEMPCLGNSVEVSNFDWNMSGVCETGRKWSRDQLAISFKLANAARLVGINLTKTVGFVAGCLGIKMSAYRNLLYTDKKWRGTVKNL